MSWTDKKALETIAKIRDTFKVKTLIETGTHMGVGARAFSCMFEKVFTTEVNTDSVRKAYETRLKHVSNVVQVVSSSPRFLSIIKEVIKDEIVIIYLDAHFYDEGLPKEKRFVILEELEALKGMRNCILVIHDYDNKKLGHITYDGISLDYTLLADRLIEVNPAFVFYTNTKEQCDILTVEDITCSPLKEIIPLDEVVLDNLKYVWSSEEKTYRGILYCTPSPLDLSTISLTRGTYV